MSVPARTEAVEEVAARALPWVIGSLVGVTGPNVRRNVLALAHHASVPDHARALLQDGDPTEEGTFDPIRNRYRGHPSMVAIGVAAINGGGLGPSLGLRTRTMGIEGLLRRRRLRSVGDEAVEVGSVKRERKRRRRRWALQCF